MYIIFIHRDHNQLEVNNFHNNFILAVELRSANFQSYSPFQFGFTHNIP